MNLLRSEVCCKADGATLAAASVVMHARAFASKPNVHALTNLWTEAHFMLESYPFNRCWQISLLIRELSIREDSVLY